MPLDPATLAAMRDSRTAFGSDEDLDIDEDFSSPVNAFAGLYGSETEGALDEDPYGDDEEDGEGDDAVKVKNPNLSNRLPREDFAPVVEFDDRPPLMERCAEVLGDRFKITKMGFMLDGKPANTDKVVAAAGLLFKDEEPIRKSPPTRRRKRAKKF